MVFSPSDKNSQRSTRNWRIAVVSNDIEALERVLQSLGYVSKAVITPRIARIVLFYRNELREYFLALLQKALKPMIARELAVKILRWKTGLA